MPDNIQLMLLVRPEGEDSDDIDLATRRLRSELQDLPIESVSLAPAGALPPGAKAGDPVALGALTLSLAPIVIPAFLEFLKSWMGRKEGRSVVIRRTIGDASTEIEIKSPVSEAGLSALVEQLSRGG